LSPFECSVFVGRKDRDSERPHDDAGRGGTEEEQVAAREREAKGVFTERSSQAEGEAWNQTERRTLRK
jgi:hypothetical protein